ncbi:MAG: exodeoxyribonuclease VII small subunit [Nitrospirota bacterium]
MATVKFEEALTRLETIVAELERGELPLDDSMRIFEEGIKLSKVCLKMLDDAERKVEILVKDKDGRKRTRPLELEEQSETGQDNGDVED